MDPCGKTQASKDPISDCQDRIERLLPPLKSEASAAREFVRSTLIEWGLDGLADDAMAITAELFNNAVMRAPSETYVLVVDRNGGTPRIEMWDSSEKLPEQRVPRRDEECGRGLLMIEFLSAAWGTHPTPTGKYVWAELDRRYAR